MPFIIRIIIQRGLALVFAFLAFFGIAPDATIPTYEETLTQTEIREEIVQNILSEKNNENQSDNYDATQIVAEAEKNLVENITPKPKNNTVEVTETSTKVSAPTVTTTSSKKVNNTNSIDDALVNILCLQRQENTISASTGSGVIISPDGLVLTNAHVAIPFLLEAYLGDNFMDCVLYRENIPTFGYKARIVYIPPEWINENADVISSPNPVGTGENDYALLYVTKNTNPTLSIPNRFSYVSVNTIKDHIDKGDAITVAGYPGAPNSIFELSRSVSLVKDQTTVNDVFTFANNNIDIFSTEITNVAQRGSSGGGVFLNNELVGLIVTTTGPEGGAKINALTTDYINRDLDSDYGSGIKSIIGSDYASLANSFESNFVEDFAKLLLQYL